MKLIYSNILVILISAFLISSCQNKEDSMEKAEPVEAQVVFDQSDARQSAEFYLNAMFAENDFEALKLMTKPDQRAQFSRSIGSLASMLVRMESAEYEIMFVDKKENLALIYQ